MIDGLNTAFWFEFKYDKLPFDDCFEEDIEALFGQFSSNCFWEVSKETDEYYIIEVLIRNLTYKQAVNIRYICSGYHFKILDGDSIETCIRLFRLI